jgi:acyl-CoA hydrolase
MIVGIRVESENIQTGAKKHCNSSYFTMVSKDAQGNNAKVPGLILSTEKQVRRFINCLKQISLKKEKDRHEEHYDYGSKEAIDNLAQYRVSVQIH